MGQALDVLGQPARVEPFDGPDDPGVERLASLLEQRAVGDLIGERMLEGVLEIREEARLVEELRSLEVSEPLAQAVLRRFRDRLQQRKGDVLPDDGGGLEEAFLLGWQPVDARGEDRLRRGGDL
jgi:hypothetical protein